MGVKNHGALTIGLDEFERAQRHFEVGNRHEDERVTLHQISHIFWYDRVHKPGLSLDPFILVQVLQGDDIALICLGPQMIELKMSKLRQGLANGLGISLSQVYYGYHLAALVQVG